MTTQEPDPRKEPPSPPTDPDEAMEEAAAQESEYPEDETNEG